MSIRNLIRDCCLLVIFSLSPTAIGIAHATSCTSPLFIEEGTTCTDIWISTNDKQDQVNYGTITSAGQWQSLNQYSNYSTNFISSIGTIENHGLINGILNEISTPLFIHAPPRSQPETYGSRIDIINNFSSGVISSRITEGITNPGVIGSILNNGTINSNNSWAIGNSGIINLIDNENLLVGAGGIGNEGYITSILNTNTIQSLGEPLPGEGAAIGSAGHIGSIINSGSIISNKQYGIGSGGTIDQIRNSGTISAAEGVGIGNRFGWFFGIPLAGVINTIENQETGIISGGIDGITNSNEISRIHNSGNISGITDMGLFNAGNINILINSGSINGSNYGLYNFSGDLFDVHYPGAIGQLYNEGTISGAGTSGIYNSGSIATLNNSGVISGTSFGIENLGNIDALSNSSTITGSPNTWIYNRPGGTIGAFINTGFISSTLSSPILNQGTIGTLTNGGTIISFNQGGGGEPLRIENNIKTINNNENGIIENKTSAFTVFAYNGTVNTFNNSGIIRHFDDGNGNLNSEAAIGVAYGQGSILNLNNFSTGTISTYRHPAIVSAYGGTISNLYNAGSISVTDGIAGDYWGKGDDGSVIFNASQMSSLTNTGSIYTNVLGAVGVVNNEDGGTIGTLNNLQGVGNTHGPLTVSGLLPKNYNVIINSPAQYGQLSASNVTGVMNFNIYGSDGTLLDDGVPRSTLSTGVYNNVLLGINDSNLNQLSGIYGNFGWILSPDGNAYDLIVSPYVHHYSASDSNFTRPYNLGWSGTYQIDTDVTLSGESTSRYFQGGSSLKDSFTFINYGNIGNLGTSGNELLPSQPFDINGSLTIKNYGSITGYQNNTINAWGSLNLENNEGGVISSIGDYTTTIAGNSPVYLSGNTETKPDMYLLNKGSIYSVGDNTWTVQYSGGGKLDFTNTGNIEARGNNGVALYVNYSAENSSILNSGTMSAGNNGYGIYIDSAQNSPTTSGDRIITRLENSGKIITGLEGIGVRNIGSIYTLNNSGTINGGSNGIGNIFYLGSLTNSGTIIGNIGVSNTGQIETINNDGSISGTTVTGLYNNWYITSLNNNGAISSPAQSAIYNAAGSIDSIVNYGTINGGSYGIENLSTIGKLSNLQGVGNNHGPLTISGLLPQNYNVIINSPTQYGQVIFNSPISSMTFDIAPSSSVTVGTYSDVLSGITLENLTNTTGRFGNYSWSLENGGSYYNLVVTSGSSSSDNTTSLDNLTPQNGSIAVDHGTSAAVSGNYSATDTVKVNGGSLTIANGGNFNAPLNVAGGAVSIASGGTLTSTTPVGVASGTLEILGNLNAPLNVSGGTVSIGSGGTLRSDNTVAVSGGSLSISGSFIAPLRVDNNGAVTVSAGGLFTSSTAVSIGNGTFSVSGNVTAPISVSGSTTLSAASLSSFSPSFVLSSSGALTGDLTLSNGGASVNGTVNGSANVGSGAALRGTGTITGASTVSSGGILAPGNSPGIMTFTASLTQGSGSTLSLDIDGATAGTGAGNYSKILVTGSGNKYTIGSGTTIQPNLRDITGSANNTFTPSIGDVFTVVSADGGVSGTFSTLTQPSSGLTSGTRFIDLYTSTEVQLKVVKSGYSTIGSSTNSNLGNVGSAIDSVSGMTSDRSTLMNAIFALSSDTDSTTVLKQLSGDIQTVSPVAAVQSIRAIGAVVDNRMASVRGGTTDTSLNSELFDFSSLTTTGTSQVVGSIIKGFSLATDQEFSDSKPWMKVLTRSSSGSSDSNGLGVNSSTVGAAAGIDYTLNSKGFVGAAIGVASNSITNGQTVTTTSASLYGSHDIGSAYIASRLSFALDDYRGSRSIDFGTISRTASANTYGYQLGGAIEIGNRYRFGTVSGELYGSFESGWLQRAAYTESGADSANLTVDELKAQTLASKLGIRINSILNQTESGNIQAFSDIAWGHDFGDTSITTSHTLMGSSFSLEGPNVGRDSAEIGIGIVSENKKGYRFFAKYAGGFRKMEISRTAELGVTMTW